MAGDEKRDAKDGSRGRTRRLWEEYPAYRNVMAVVVLAGAVGGIVATVLGLWPDDNPSKPVRQNVEWVLDDSAGMAEPLDGSTKLAAAVAAINSRAVRLNRANLALRRFGGECGEASDALVGFGTGRAGDIAEHLAEQTPAGEANLAGAVVEAATDYGDVERFPADVSKRIIVVTGRGDTCEADPAAVIARDVPADIDVDLQFVGLRVPSGDRQELEEMAARFEGGRVQFVDTDEGLRSALGDVAAPVGPSTRMLAETMAAEADRLNAITNADTPAEARAALAEAVKKFAAADPLLVPLARTFDRSRACRQLNELTRLARDADRRGLRLAPTLIELRERAESGAADDVEAYNEVLTKWNAGVGVFNDAFDRIQKVIAGGACS